MTESSPRASRLTPEAAALLAVLLAFYLAFHSRNILAIDGNHRAFEVWQRQALFFHGNGHLLYPVNVLLWTGMLRALGFRLESPFAFFAAVTWMNALAAVVALAVFYLLVVCVTEHRGVSLVATAALGVSNCFLTQAVNGNEPMVGFAWAMLALYAAVGSRPGRRTALAGLLLSGILFALSMATYRSMVLLAPAALLAVWFSWSGRRSIAALALILGALSATAAIYGSAYWLEGKRSLLAALAAFASEEGARGFLRLTPGKLLEVPLGLTSSIFPLLRFQPFNGMRGILHGSATRLFWLGILPLLICAVLAASLAATWRLRPWMARRQRLAWMAATAGLLFTWLPAILWDPTYSKLLMQPLACIVFLCALGMSVASRRRKARRLWWAGALTWLAAACATLPVAVRDHSRGTPWLGQTARLAAMVGPEDFVVGGWDPVSTLYSSLWVEHQPDSSHPYVSVLDSNAHFLSFPSEAAMHGEAAVDILRAAIVSTRQRHGRVYFIGLLDLPRSDWEALLGRSFGVPYGSVATLRSHSRIVLELSEAGSVEPVRLLLDDEH